MNNVSFQWLANYLISYTYPLMMKFSGGMTYGFYGLMAILSVLFVWKMIPETKGKSLENKKKKIGVGEKKVYLCIRKLVWTLRTNFPICGEAEVSALI